MDREKKLAVWNQNAIDDIGLEATAASFVTSHWVEFIKEEELENPEIIGSSEVWDELLPQSVAELGIASGRAAEICIEAKKAAYKQAYEVD